MTTRLSWRVAGLMLTWVLLADMPRATSAAGDLQLCVSSDLLFVQVRRCAPGVGALVSLAYAPHVGAIPINFVVASAPALKDLEKLGQDVSRGDYHLVVIGGTEYGWLKKHDAELQLEPLVIVHVGLDVHGMVLIVAKTSKFVEVADLRGSKLISLHAQSLMTDFSLDGILHKDNLELKGFFQRNDNPYKNPLAAVAALKSGKADCLVTDYGTWYNAKSRHPELENDVKIFRYGPTLPNGVFVGRPANLNKLHPGLWNELKRLLEQAHETEEGEECLAFWSIQRFKPAPDAGFETLVNDRVRDFDLFCHRTEVKQK